jgi:hypothetical protein
VANNIEGNYQHSPKHVEVEDASESLMQQVMWKWLNNNTKWLLVQLNQMELSVKNLGANEETSRVNLIDGTTMRTSEERGDGYKSHHARRQ